MPKPRRNGAIEIADRVTRLVGDRQLYYTEMWFPVHVPGMEILDGIYAVAYED